MLIKPGGESCSDSGDDMEQKTETRRQGDARAAGAPHEEEPVPSLPDPYPSAAVPATMAQLKKAGPDDDTGIRGRPTVAHIQP